MVDEELKDPMHYIMQRSRRLHGVNMSCPNCSTYMHVIGIKLFPKWICYKCNTAVEIEPLKLIKE